MQSSRWLEGPVSWVMSPQTTKILARSLPLCPWGIGMFSSLFFPVLGLPAHNMMNTQTSIDLQFSFKKIFYETHR